MHKDPRVLIAVSAAILFLPSLAFAGDKPPTPYDRTRAGYVSDGRQNYPFVLRGVTIDWDISCNKGQAADCLKLAKAFEGGRRARTRSARGGWLLHGRLQARFGGGVYPCRNDAERRNAGLQAS